MESTSKLLSVVALAFVHLLLAMVMIHRGLDALWLAMYLAVALFYAALYFHGLHQLRADLRRRLRNAAVALGAFLSAFFFYNFAAGMSWWAAVVVWLGIAVALCLLYGVIMPDPEEEAVTTVRAASV